MGRLDQRFAETANTVVHSRRGFPRYSKRFNRRGNRKSLRGASLGQPNWGLTHVQVNRIGRRHRVD